METELNLNRHHRSTALLKGTQKVSALVDEFCGELYKLIGRFTDKHPDLSLGEFAFIVAASYKWLDNIISKQRRKK